MIDSTIRQTFLLTTIFPEFFFQFFFQMTAPNNLELQGSFQRSPLAELLVELRQTRLDGSLRLERETNKTIIYFKTGEIVFAVSNARSARIFEMLVRAGKIDKQFLAE